MKNKGFLIVILVTLALVIVYFIFRPKFTWDVTYSSTDTEPYGCELFDSIMRLSIKSGYEVAEIDPDTLMSVKANRKKTILCLRDGLSIDPDIMMPFVREGGNVVIATTYLNYDICVELGMSISDLPKSSDIIPIEGQFTTLTYLPDRHYKQKDYKISSCLCDLFLYEYDLQDDEEKKRNKNLKWKNIVMQKEGKKEYISTAKANYGNGTIVFCPLPLLFTNYGIMEGNNHELIMRILSQCGNRPIIRTSYQSPVVNEGNVYNESQGSPSSIMDHILSDKSLQTAYYLALLGLILFFIFTARRKQRIIPVTTPKSNGQLEFIKQIGDMYKRNHATDNIIKKKFHFLTDKIRRQLRVDISRDSIEEEQVSTIAAYTKMDKDEVRSILNTMKSYFNSRKSQRERLREEIIKTQEKTKRWNWSEEMNNAWIEKRVEEKMSSTNVSEMIRLLDLMNKIDEKI